MAVIPGPAQERLLRLMRFLEKDRLVPITSAEVERQTGWSRDSLRKDISYLGEYSGVKAVGTSAGYTPEQLVPIIKRALGLDRRRRFCVVGLGRLGSAYLNFRGLEPEEFELCAGFDTNVNRVEILKSQVPLYPAYKMGEVIRRFSVEIALLCVPEDAAQGAAEKLTAAGIRGILNFAPVVLKTPPEVVVRNVHVADEMRALAIRLHNKGKEWANEAGV
jgi:redox-sensing transcriptional repressor